MNVLVDTNIWLDMALGRKEFVRHSRGAVAVCIEEDIGVSVSGTSLKDVFYLVDQQKGDTKAYSCVEEILAFAKVLSIDEAVCRRAFDLERPDYEDGIIAAAALLNKVDAIISRDARAFNALPIPKYSPKEFIAAQRYTEIDF